MKHMMIEGGWADLFFLDDIHEMFHITNAEILALERMYISLQAKWTWIKPRSIEGIRNRQAAKLTALHDTLGQAW